MKANELRIGNYIQKNGRIATVEIINGEIDEIFFLGEDFYYSDQAKDIKPIPLTEEWLLKFGFKIGKSQEYYEFEFCEMFGYDNKDWSFRYLNNLIKLNLKHVHHLQNLYFSLTGEELITV